MYVVCFFLDMMFARFKYSAMADTRKKSNDFELPTTKLGVFFAGEKA